MYVGDNYAEFVGSGVGHDECAAIDDDIRRHEGDGNIAATLGGHLGDDKHVGPGLAYLSEQVWSLGQLQRLGAVASLPELHRPADTFHDKRRLAHLPWTDAFKPKAPTFLVLDDFVPSGIPAYEAGIVRRLLQQGIHVLPVQDEMTVVDRHAAVHDARHAADGRLALVDEDRCALHKIRIDLPDLLHSFAVVDDLLAVGSVAPGKAYHDAMDVRLVRGLAVPPESASGKQYVHPGLVQFAPKDGDLLALRNGIGGDESYLCPLSAYRLQCLLVPSGHVVDVPYAFGFLVEKARQVFLLLAGLLLLPHKRRVAHDVVEADLVPCARLRAALHVGSHQVDVSVCRCRFVERQGVFFKEDIGVPGMYGRDIGRDFDDVPVHPQCIPFPDVGVALEGQEFDVVVDDFLCLAEHLRLRYPKGRGSNRDGKVVYLDAVELPDADLDGRKAFPCELRLPMCILSYGFVLQATQAQVGFREEIAGAAGRVEEGEGGQLVLIGHQLPLPLPLYLLFEDVVKLLAQVVEEQWVDDLVDVLDAGVVHASAATRLRIQRALEHASEDGGRYLAPVETEARVLQEYLPELFGELRYLYLFLEKPAIGVGEGCEVILQVFAALRLGRVQHLEEVAQGTAQVLGFVAAKVVMELVVGKDARILGIETEHQSDTQDVEPAQGPRRVVVVLPEQSLVNLPHYLAGLHRHLHLLAQVLALHIDKEPEPIVFLAEVLQQDALRFAVGLLHVIDKELGKVASYNPSRPLGIGQLGRIAFCLLEGSEALAVALSDGCTEVLVDGLLLDEHTRRADMAVDEVGGIHLHLFLVANEVGNVLHAEDVLEQVGPEYLGVPFLVAAPFPSQGKFRCSRSNLFLCFHSLACYSATKLMIYSE